MCIGRKVAELEMLTLLAAIVTRFQVRCTEMMCPPCPTIRYQVGWQGGEMRVRSNTLLYPEGPLPFTFHKR